jgi:hypothetical protein
VLGSAVGTASEGRPFRIEYAILDLGREKVVAGFLAPPDDMAFNLSLVRGALLGFEAERLLTREVRAPLKVAFELVPYPGATAGALPLPAGWVSEPTTKASCEKAGGAEAGLAASPPGDFTVVFRALIFDRAATTSETLARECGGQTESVPFSRRSRHLGVDRVTRGAVLTRGEAVLLLEAEAPEAKAGFVRDFFDAWIRQVPEPAARPEG